jgi:hypothetical protein
MAIDLRLPHYSWKLPWFIYDLYSAQIITAFTVPGDMTDSKEIVLTETPIPGLNYSPIMPGGNGNRKISFTLPLMKRNNTTGSTLVLKQFDNLRNQARKIEDIFANQFNPNPKVLYYWGTGSLPLVYFVKKCDFTHKEMWTNEQGFPQFSEVALELWLDESHLLYKAEEVFRKVSAIVSMTLEAASAATTTVGITKGKAV